MKNNMKVIAKLLRTQGQDAAQAYFMSLSDEERDEVIQKLRIGIEAMTDSMISIAESIATVIRPVMEHIVQIADDINEIKGLNGHNSD